MAIREITVDDLGARLAAGATLVDVREDDEYERGHVPGAVTMPLATVPDHVDELRGHEELYVICHSGGRSARACEYLAGEGVGATNVEGGTSAWTAAGGDIES